MRKSLFLALACVSVCFAQTKKIKVVVLTGQHSYQNDFFTKVMDVQPDFDYKHVDLPGESEIFEDVSNWNYDVIVFYNSGQKISAKREQNLLSLLNKGVGVVVLHHAVCAYEDFPEFKQIVGSKFHGNPETIDGHTYASNYKEPTTVPIVIDDKQSPLMKGFKDTTITDEVYTDMSYVATGSHILAHTTNQYIPGKQIIWTRRYSNANVFTITIGHTVPTITGPIMKKLVPDAIRWTVASAPSATIAAPKNGNVSASFLPQGKIFFRNPGVLDKAWDAKGSLLIIR